MQWMQCKDNRPRSANADADDDDDDDEDGYLVTILVVGYLIAFFLSFFIDHQQWKMFYSSAHDDKVNCNKYKSCSNILTTGEPSIYIDNK